MPDLYMPSYCTDLVLTVIRHTDCSDQSCALDTGALVSWVVLAVLATLTVGV